MAEEQEKKLKSYPWYQEQDEAKPHKGVAKLVYKPQPNQDEGAKQ